MAIVTSINDLTGPHEQHLSGLSDDALQVFQPLPDESDPGWQQEPFELFDRAGLFIALADQIAERRLIDGIEMLLDRACFGDPGEMMRGLRHALEAACGGNWATLAEACSRRTTSGRSGTRLWAMAEIAARRDPVALDAVQARLTDIETNIRREALLAAEMLGQHHPVEARTLLSDLRTMAESDPDPGVRGQAAASSNASM